MMILITAPGEYLLQTKTEPIVGRVYSLEDQTRGTAAQNNAFHALISEYYNSGAWSYQGACYTTGATYDEFRNLIKRNLGAGFEAFVYIDYVDNKAIICDAKTIQDIPESVRRDPDRKSLIRGRLKSWADYTKKERRETMDKLIAEMHQVGVNTPKFQEILQGMEDMWK